MADSWIWAKLQGLVRDVERLFQNFQYGEAGRQIYEFFWSDFADWYVEIAKGQLAEGSARAYKTADTLARVLDISLRLLHPFTPFVTEELWGHLRRALQDSPLADLTEDWPEVLIIAGWPETRDEEGWEPDKVADFMLMQEIVRSIRNLRAEKKVRPSRKLLALIFGDAKTNLLTEQSTVIAMLAGLDPSKVRIHEKPRELFAFDGTPIEVGSELGSIEGYNTLVVGSVEIYLPLAELGDPAEDRVRLEKELAEAESQITRLEKLLASDFAKKAPEAVVAKEREKLAAYKDTAEKIRVQL